MQTSKAPEQPRIHADLGNPHYVAWLDLLEKSEHWTLSQIADYQLSQVRRMVDYAYQNSSGYRELYRQHGVAPDSIRTIEDIRKLPFVEKELIRDRLEEFSVPLEGRYYVTTGGSTGVPCGMYRDPVSFARELASKAHQYHRVGWIEGTRQIVFRGLNIDTPDHMQFVSEFNELRCSSYHFGTASMEQYRQRALEYAPEWIRCYPSSGYVFARFLGETGRSLPRLKGILCSSEHLYDFQKELMQQVFGTRIFSHYGHYEMAVLAGFCEYQDTYHVLPQYGYAELIDREGRPVTQPGRVGEIVGTSFIMHATPFIRYRTQDLARLRGWGCSACGRPYQVWERIEGRLQELIVTRSGRYISTSMLNMHDRFNDCFKQFQFHQREPGKLTFRYIPKETLPEHALAQLSASLVEKLQDDVDLEMVAVDSIPLTPRGKHKLLIQELEVKYHDAALDEALTL